MSGATEYWLADFSVERRRATRRLVESLSTEARLTSSLAIGLQHLLDGSHDLLRHAPLSTWEKLESTDLAGLSLASDSGWDSYLRGLTPDLPDNLANHLTVWLLGS